MLLRCRVPWDRQSGDAFYFLRFDTVAYHYRLIGGSHHLDWVTVSPYRTELSLLKKGSHRATLFQKDVIAKPVFEKEIYVRRLILYEDGRTEDVFVEKGTLDEGKLEIVSGAKLASRK